MKRDAAWRETVRQEIELWADKVLAKPSDHFNGQPACPFALPALRRKAVQIFFGGQHAVNDICRMWPNLSIELALVVQDNDEWCSEDIEKWCESMNETLSSQDLVLMPFVPSSNALTGQAEEETTDWEPLIEDEYTMVFVQNLSALKNASDYLESKGYYQKCTSHFKEYVRHRSERLENAR